MTVEVIEWPEKGSARRFPMGGWWVVERRPGWGYFPLAGPFRTEGEARAALDARRAAWEAGETVPMSDPADAATAGARGRPRAREDVVG